MVSIYAWEVNDEKNPVTIEGVVGAVDCDEAGQVSLVSILTDTYEEYLVVDNKAGKELLEREGEEVRATGMVSESEFGEFSIIVSTYEVLDNELLENEVVWEAWDDAEDDYNN